MNSDEFGSKVRLISAIRNIAAEHESGIISILTETKRSVLLKFSSGKLIHSYSRNKDIGEVIQLLNEGQFVKFNFANIPRESGTELMPIEAFIQFLEVGDSHDSLPAHRTASKQGKSGETDQTDFTVNLVQEKLINIASEYVGLVADIMVEEAFESASDPLEVIEIIAETIPDAEEAQKFRTAALKSIRMVSF